MNKIILSLSVVFSMFFANAQEINTIKPKSPVVLAVEVGSNVGVQFGLTLDI